MCISLTRGFLTELEVTTFFVKTLHGELEDPLISDFVDKLHGISVLPFRSKFFKSIDEMSEETCETLDEMPNL